MSGVESALLVRMEATLNKFEKQMSRARKVATDTAVSNERRFANSNKRMSASAEKSAQTIGREMDRLRSKYDPLFAASKRYEAELGELNRAHKIGAINMGQYESALERINAEYARTSIGAQKAAAASQKLDTAQVASGTGLARYIQISNAGRFVLQNTAAQVGDMAVQWEMGTSKARIMSQQLPQLLGGFGALGGVLGTVAPLLGVIAAVGIPVAAMLMMVGDESEKTSKKVKTFEDRLSDAEAALGRAQSALQTVSRGGADDLASIYGLVTEKVRDLSAALLDIEIRAAQLNVDTVLKNALGEDYQKQVEGMFGAVGAALVSSASEHAKAEAEEIRQLVSELQSQMDMIGSSGQAVPQALVNDMTALQEELAAVEGRFGDIGSLADDLAVPPDVLSSYADLEDRLDAARSAGDFGAIADILSEMRGILERVGDEIDQGVKDQLTQAEDQARKLAKTMDEAKAAAEDTATAASSIAGGISPAVLEAQALAKWLGISLTTAKRLAVLGPQGLPQNNGDKDGLVYSGRGGDPRTQGGSFSDRQNADAIVFLENYKTPSSSRGGKSGRGSETKPFFEGVEQQIQNLERQIETIGKTDAQIAELTARYKLLDEAKERNLKLDQKQAASGKTLREEIDAQAASVGRLTEKAERYKEQAAFMDGLNQDLKDGFIDAIIEGESFGDVLENVAKSLAKAALQAAIFGDGPLANLFGGGSGGGGLISIFGGLFKNAKGNAFSNGRVVPFAKGTVLSSPQTFPMANGDTGLMGEAGPEAIMPLKRGPDGKLGVQASGGGGAVVIEQHIHLSTGVQQTVRTEVQSMLPQIAHHTKKAVADAVRRDPNYKSAF
jgi:hypothetical protein